MDFVRRLTRFTAFFFVLLCAALILYGTAVYFAWKAQPFSTGTVIVQGIRQRTTVRRDRFWIPHISAANQADLAFAEGFSQGTDRLFQMDMLRRYAYGRLSEVFGPSETEDDIQARVVDVRGIVYRQWSALSADRRAELLAFAQGVNAAERLQPLPVEFVALGYHPQPWQPQDSLAVAFTIYQQLIESWDDDITRKMILNRLGNSAVQGLYPLTDPKYNASILQPQLKVGAMPSLTLNRLSAPAKSITDVVFKHSDSLGSNAWAAGAKRTAVHHALLANDPHLMLSMPEIWYLEDLQCGNVHVAGAAIAGVPGIILGHNEHLAWGVTNGSVETVEVFQEHFRNGTDMYNDDGIWRRANTRLETIRVRFGRAIRKAYYRTRRGFVVFADGQAYSVRWTEANTINDPLKAFADLAKAQNYKQVTDALGRYQGPPQNFIIADTSGRVYYTLAGAVLKDAVLNALPRHPDSAKSEPTISTLPYGALPKLSPSQSALIVSANNVMYGAGYPYRLSQAFDPPYRAWEIKRTLAPHQSITIQDFIRAQDDVKSVPEKELATEVVWALANATDNNLRQVRTDLANFDGRFEGGSVAATEVYLIRRSAIKDMLVPLLGHELSNRYLQSSSGFVTLLRLLREKPHGWVTHDDYAAFLRRSISDAIAVAGGLDKMRQPWGSFGGVSAAHPFRSFGITWWDGARFPGNGDQYSPHVQTSGFSQSFRAVWDTGNWSGGGIILPNGESGRPNSPHYRDQSTEWIHGHVLSMPWTSKQIAAATESTLLLTPKR